MILPDTWLRDGKDMMKKIKVMRDALNFKLARYDSLADRAGYNAFGLSVLALSLFLDGTPLRVRYLWVRPHCFEFLMNQNTMLFVICLLKVNLSSVKKGK